MSKIEIEVGKQLQKQKEETQKSLVNILNLIDSMEQWMRYEYNQILKKPERSNNLSNDVNKNLIHSDYGLNSIKKNTIIIFVIISYKRTFWKFC